MKKKIQRWQGAIVEDPFFQQQHPILQRIYSARKVKSPSDLERECEHLLPPNGLLHIDKAANIIADAIIAAKKIVIVGDYDADGATSSALAVKALRAFGAEHVDYVVPNRFDYGYGLTPPIVELVAKKNADLIITVDNGISSIDGVLAAKAKGMQVVVTDHHLAGEHLPAADAIVNPNQPGDTFASKNLAGVGVLFYVMVTVRRVLASRDYFSKKNIAQVNMTTFLDLVALGTVADVVPLDKNNRILVYQGLRRIRARKCSVGILALLDVAKRNHVSIVASDLGFAVGPRLNAAGRLDDMSLGIECLLTTDEPLARKIANELDVMNQERRGLEQEMQQQALSHLSRLSLEDTQNLMGVCLYDKRWHQGVVGILASRIKDTLFRPVIAFARGDNGDLKGSGRSIPGVHIRDVLAYIDALNPGLIIKFGGHAMAAGLSIAEKDFKQFARCFDTVVDARVDHDILQNIMQSDGELAPADFSLPLAQLMRESGPWGQAFSEPLFDGKFSIIDQRLVGTHHLKLVLGVPGGEYPINAIAFNVNTDAWPNERCEKIHAAYRLDVNEFRGVKSVQLIIEYFEAEAIA